MTPDLTRLAKAVVARLVDLEPRPANHGPGWLIAVDRRIRSERWAEVCALVAEHPDLDVDTLASMASPAAACPPEGGVIQQEPPNPSATLQVWDGPERDPADGELVDDIDAVRPHLERAREALAGTRKPPMGPPPVPTRGRVA